MTYNQYIILCPKCAMLTLLSFYLQMPSVTIRYKPSAVRNASAPGSRREDPAGKDDGGYNSHVEQITDPH